MLTILLQKFIAWRDCARGAQSGFLSARGSAYLVLSGDVSRLADRAKGFETR
jgi:hypothetical protein